MTGVLSLAFVIAILVVFVIITAGFSLLYILTGRSRPAVGWLVACLVSGGLLMSVMGGVLA